MFFVMNARVTFVYAALNDWFRVALVKAFVFMRTAKRVVRFAYGRAAKQIKSNGERGYGRGAEVM
jgi:hypothetical protein